MDRDEKPSKTPHLHVRSVDGFLFPEAIAITGNAKGLLQLRRQIDRALAAPDPKGKPLSGSVVNWKSMRPAGGADEKAIKDKKAAAAKGEADNVEDIPF